MQTLERPATVHRLIMNRRLAINRAGLAVYVPTGASKSKTEARKRMSRHYFVGKKTLTAAWTMRLKVFIKKPLPMLLAHKQLQEELRPPKRDGEDAFGLFTCFSPSEFLKQVLQPVTGCNSNDVRAAIEHELKTLCRGNRQNLNVVQHQSGHPKEVSIKHYQSAGRDLLADSYRQLMPDL